MGHTCLHELHSVFFGPRTRLNKMQIGPNDKEAVRHVEDDRRVRDYVICEGVTVRAGKLNDYPVHAKDPLDSGAAELQPGRQEDADGENAERGQPGETDQVREPPPRHEGGVVQRSAYSQIPVVGHDCQDGQLTASVGVHDKSLQQTTLIRDFLRKRQQIEKELREETRRAINRVNANAAE